MNLFVTDKCPVKSAQAIDKVRLGKMQLELCEMAAFLLSDLKLVDYMPLRKDGLPYRVSEKNRHRKHPVTLWMKSKKAHFEWSIQHLIAMNEEFKFRGGNDHCTAINPSRFEAALKYISDDGSDLKHITFQNSSWCKWMDPVEGYRFGFIHKWVTKDKKMPSWGVRGEPSWLEEYAHRYVDEGIQQKIYDDVARIELEKKLLKKAAKNEIRNREN